MSSKPAPDELDDLVIRRDLRLVTFHLHYFRVRTQDKSAERMWLDLTTPLACAIIRISLCLLSKIDTSNRLKIDKTGKAS